MKAPVSPRRLNWRCEVIRLHGALFFAIHQLPNHGSKDQLHCERHLAAGADNGVRPRHERVRQHRQKIGEVDAPRITIVAMKGIALDDHRPNTLAPKDLLKGRRHGSRART